jgi:hypothetical protein
VITEWRSDRVGTIRRDDPDVDRLSEYAPLAEAVAVSGSALLRERSWARWSGGRLRVARSDSRAAVERPGPYRRVIVISALTIRGPGLRNGYASRSRSHALERTSAPCRVTVCDPSITPRL